MKNKQYSTIIDPEDIHINEDIVIYSIGYRQKTYPDSLPGLIATVLSEYHSYLSIQAGWVAYHLPDIDVKNGKILCGDVEFICGKIIAGAMKKSEDLYMFLVSIGPGITEWSGDRSSRDQYLLAYIIDTVGSIAVEAAADHMGDILSQKVTEDGKHVSNRYSPGYCGWDIKEQHKLFSFFPPEFCGVTLTDSALMIPIKSVSGIIGSGSDLKKSAYSCKICSQKDCIMRKNL